MKSIWTLAFLATTLSSVASQSVAQQNWDQPSTLGSYRSVTHSRYPGMNQDTQPMVDVNDMNMSPSDLNFANGNPQSGNATPAYNQNPGFNSSNNCDGCGNGQIMGNYGSNPCGAQAYYGPGSAYSGCGNSVGSPNGYFNNQNQGIYSGNSCNGTGRNRGGYRPNGYGNSYDNSCGNYGQYSSDRRNSSANWVGGVGALIFRRDYEDDRGMGFNAAGDYLFSTDADMGTMAGMEASLGRRGCNGYGWEARYWGLYPGASIVTFGGTPYSSLGGLSDVFHVPSNSSVLNIFNQANVHQLTRNNDVTNLEFNMLRNAGTSGSTNYELFGGFRWLQFEEKLTYSAFSSYAGHPATFHYNNCVTNNFLGLQMGGRGERCMTGRLRLATSFSCGLFNNRINASQRMYDEDSGTDALIYAGPFNGRPYNYSSRKNDIAMMGELNIGTYYLISSSLRLSVGYRAIGVSGVALAPDQMPYNFTDGNDIQRIESNGSLILHGAYVGLQSCF